MCHKAACVLTPRLFCGVLKFAMRKWRRAVGQPGIDLMDGGPNLLDLCFADDILSLPAHVTNWGHGSVH